ncbi:MAG TPA: 3-deoxy-7-phosphoheptulonate synthase, partial [Erysipelotrichaceae bacterium]|nr:3-deoxy-7-phosphoheptulonate synthase [Erysipelotrichaceae bacterium]
MIITLKKDAPKEEVDALIQRFNEMNLQVHMIYGDSFNVFGLVG